MVNQTRRELRAQLLSTRAAILPSDKAVLDAQLAAQVAAYIRSHCAAGATIALYNPIRGEPDLRLLADELSNDDFKIALPVVVERNAPLGFACANAALKIGAYGIAEPQGATDILPDVVVIPCVGFNAQNYRLGYGGGYYDRTLAAWTHDFVSIGVAYAQTVCTFEVGEFDVALDWIANV